MSKYVINDTTLTAIGDAVRAKGGTTELIPVSGLATAITNLPSGGGGEKYFTDEELTFSGNLTGLFSYDKWTSVLEKDKNRIKITEPTSLNSFLEGSSGTDYSFLTIEGNGKTPCGANYILKGLRNVEKFPVFKNVVINANQCSNMICVLWYFTNVDELIKFFDSITFSNSNFQSLNLFSYCYSLRNVDAVMPYFKKALANYNSGAFYDGCFQSMYALDEINNIPIMNGTKTYNGFSYTFGDLCRAKNITFDTDNGVPYIAQWKGQKIDLTWMDGVGCLGSYPISNLLDYNSGITADKEVKDDATYQALKNNPDWFTKKIEYSRQNHDSAVNTINSLPDTSAYLATAGGTNTIKFRGNAGSLTDGGAINTLTEEEIAVATAAIFECLAEFVNRVVGAF